MNKFTVKYSNSILIILLIIAFFLRFHKIGEHGLAGDEKYSLFVSQFVSYEGNNQHDSVRKPSHKYFTPKEFWSKKSLPDFFDSIARIDTGNGAFYTYSLHFWSQLVGLQDGNLRMLSLLFNLLTIILLYIFVKTHFRSENLALLAAFLATISPFFIAYSQVARNYSMNMFFALLSTHLFLKIIQKEEKNEKPFLDYLFYGIAVLLCEMCHISSFPLFMIQALYVLIYFRKIRGHVGFSLAMLIPFIGLGLWLNCEGGKWIFHYVNNSVKVYNQMATTNPDDYLSLANPKNILRQLRHVISAIFLFIDGFPSIFSSLKIVYSLVFLSSIISLVIFIKNTVNLPANNAEKKLRIFLLLLAFIPIISLVFFAYKDGNTFRIIPRYIAYSYSFNIVLISLIIKDLWKEKNTIRIPFFIVFTIQLLLIFSINKSIWEDNPPRYFMSFSEPRKANPYQFSAEKIKSNYAVGDTVIYPSLFIQKEGGYAMPEYSVVDAQLVNFYLPKNSEIIQRVEPQEPNKIIIKKMNGRTLLIFDFEGNKYRY